MDGIEIKSLYGARSQRGLVELRWDGKAAQLLVGDARRHAFAILDAAASAEFDELLAEVMWEAGCTASQIATLIGELRDLYQAEEGDETQTMKLSVEQLAVLRLVREAAHDRLRTALRLKMDQKYPGRAQTLLSAIDAKLLIRHG